MAVQITAATPLMTGCKPHLGDVFALEAAAYLGELGEELGVLGRPIGAIMMPLVESWSTNGRGRLSKAAQTTMRSKGPSPGSPLEPSAWRTKALVMPSVSKRCSRLFGQRLVAVDGDHPGRQPRHHRGGESRAGADFQHAMAGFKLKGRDHGRLKVGALQGLAALDRHHAVRPGDRLPGARHEVLRGVASIAATRSRGGVPSARRRSRKAAKPSRSSSMVFMRAPSPDCP